MASRLLGLDGLDALRIFVGWARRLEELARDRGQFPADAAPMGLLGAARPDGVWPQTGLACRAMAANGPETTKPQQVGLCEFLDGQGRIWSG